MSTATPEQVLESIVTGINSGISKASCRSTRATRYSRLSPAASLPAHPASGKP